MAPKDSRRQGSHQTGSKTSRDKPPNKGESVRQSTQKNAEQNSFHERSREPASRSTPRSIVSRRDEKTQYTETVDDLSLDDSDSEDGFEKRQRSISGSHVIEDRHQQRTTGTHDIRESTGETQHFSLVSPRDGLVSRHQLQSHTLQRTKPDISYGDFPVPSRYPQVLPPPPVAGSAAPSVQICLSQLAFVFTQIEVIDFKNCQKFIQEQPAILKEDDRHFRCQAALAYDKGNKQYARACVHRSLMINKCSKLDAGELEEYLRHLTGESKSALKHFMNDLDATYEHMKANISPLMAAGNRLVQQSTPRGQTVHSNFSGEPPKTSVRRPSTNTRHIETSPGIHENFGDLSITEGLDDRYQPPRKAESASDRHHRPQGSTHSRGGSGYQGSHASVGPNEYNYRGTPGDLDTLDPRYKRQKDPARFFCVGKVFAILWHENVGQSKQDPGPDVITSEGRFGERIFSHIRRMIVIRDRYGYCWCVGINTYGKRGIAGKRMSLAEAKAHTIAHDSREDAQYLEGEEAIVKEPIAIDMNPGHTLETASRLNFAKVFTVEHNVKVMSLGRVASGSLHYLRAYWANESSGSLTS